MVIQWYLANLYGDIKLGIKEQQLKIIYWKTPTVTNLRESWMGTCLRSVRCMANLGCALLKASRER